MRLHEEGKPKRAAEYDGIDFISEAQVDGVLIPRPELADGAVCSGSGRNSQDHETLWRCFAGVLDHQVRACLDAADFTIHRGFPPRANAETSTQPHYSAEMINVKSVFFGAVVLAGFLKLVFFLKAGPAKIRTRWRHVAAEPDHGSWLLTRRRMMLVLSRKRNESIVINDNVKVTIVDVKGDRVRVGIEAPKEVPVHRQEVYDTIHDDGTQEDGKTDES